MLDEHQEEIKATGNVAPLRNVMLLNTLINRIQNREDLDLPGMGTFYGPSGYGKSMAAVWSAQNANAYWVEVRSTWTRKKFAQKIMQAMGFTRFPKTVGDMVEEIGEQLGKSGRPLLIDEADLVATDSMIKVVRDIYELSAGGTVILIGEENLPTSLERWERVHNRMFDHVPAQPADLREAKLLAQLKQPGLQIDDDVMQAILEVSHARARRIVTNVSKLAEYALKTGDNHITAADAARIKFDSGSAPAPRSNL